MKKYILLIIAAIFCLPNISFAQDGPMLINAPREYQPVDPARAAWNSMVNSSNKSISSKPQKPSKPRVKVSYLRAAEVSTDEATGLTTLRWNDGSSYIGITNSGAMLVGTMTYADGSKYVGPWVRNMPNGNGTFQTPEGITFTTTFVNGVPHGKGVIQDLDGRKYSARWVRGVLKEKSIKPLEEK